MSKPIHRVYVGDTNYFPIHVYVKQDQKYYEYVPQVGDKFVLKFYDRKTGDEKHVQTVNVEKEPERYIVVKLDHLEAGEYKVDVRMTTVDGDTHLICNDMLLTAEEDE